MYEKPILTVILEYLIFAGLGYFVYLSHGWALGVSIALIGLLLLGIQGSAKEIISRLNVLYDKA